MLCLRCGKSLGDKAGMCPTCQEKIAHEEQQANRTAQSPDSPAGFWLRFFASLFDYVVVSALSTLFAFIINAISVASLFSLTFSDFEFPKREEFALGVMAFYLAMLLVSLVIIFIAGFIYHAAFECSKLQASPGKLVMGLRVSDEQYQAITFGRACARNFGKILSTLTFCIGFLMAGFTSEKQALHDKVAKCLVLKRSNVPTAVRVLGAVACVCLSIAWSALTAETETTFSHTGTSVDYQQGSIDAVGSIDGQVFRPDRAIIRGGNILIFRQGSDFFADKQMSIWTFEDDSVEGKTFTASGRNGFKPQVTVSVRYDTDKIPDTEMELQINTLHIRFGERHGNLIPGHVSVSVGGKRQAQLEGTFVAEYE